MQNGEFRIFAVNSIGTLTYLKINDKNKTIENHATDFGSTEQMVKYPQYCCLSVEVNFIDKLLYQLFQLFDDSAFVFGTPLIFNKGNDRARQP